MPSKDSSDDDGDDNGNGDGGDKESPKHNGSKSAKALVIGLLTPLGVVIVGSVIVGAYLFVRHRKKNRDDQFSFEVGVDELNMTDKDFTIPLSALEQEDNTSVQ